MTKQLIVKRETLEKLRGRKGDKGDKGDTVVGTTGIQGLQGEFGIAGTDGKEGIQGFAGKAGIDGKVGASGLDGKAGLPGLMGPIPKHEWRNKSLRFQEGRNASGTVVWGRFVDLKGDKGDPSLYYPGGSGAGSVDYESVTVNRDGDDLITSIVQGNKTWTITRDGADCITSVTDGSTTRTINYLNNKVTSVTIS